MPRKAFIADLQKEKDGSGKYPEHIFNLRAGDDDGTFAFDYIPPWDVDVAVTVQAYIADVGDYPNLHNYFVYTSSENVPPAVNTALSDPSIFDGLTISQMLQKVASVLDCARAGSEAHSVPHDEDDDDHGLDVDGPEALDTDFEDGNESESGSDFGEDGYGPTRVDGATNRAKSLSDNEKAELKHRIQSDVSLAKQAGFRVGILGEILYPGCTAFLTLSCRIAKLKIAEDALKAWHLNPERYILLIIQYKVGYQTTEQLSSNPLTSRIDVKLRVGMSTKYKVAYEQASAAFAHTRDENCDSNCVKPSSQVPPSGDEESTQVEENKVQDTGVQPIFISRPLNDLLNERLFDIIGWRLAMGFSWGSAEAYFNDNQGRRISPSETIDAKYLQDEAGFQPKSSSKLPELVTADHLSQPIAKFSFPLVAMQFTLRHLVRCTEFCLVCHDQLKASFEALKPYVCSKPLCLYQYMALGFGPSIEHEILTQPHVVDLLVSFCFTTAYASSLKDFPDGMALTVPPPGLNARYHRPPNMEIGWDQEVINHEAAILSAPKIISAKYDPRNDELVFSSTSEKPLVVGDWIHMRVLKSTDPIQHRRVIGVWYPTVRLAPRPHVAKIPTAGLQFRTEDELSAPDPTESPSVPQPLPNSCQEKFTLLDASIIVYNHNFDDLNKTDKQICICQLLSTLPSVDEMKFYLKSGGHKQRALRSWVNRTSPAAFGLLQWIIASNRSCIVQIDNLGSGSAPSEDRVYGMQSYIQFRFAQGAPDKEQRFITAVKDKQEKLSLKYPTIFAWHGSPLKNWHGIVREGLNYDRTLHGRAYGDGVYHSLDVQVSLGYSTTCFFAQTREVLSTDCWPQSKLMISQALCLNEIVNAPQEFTAATPHIVVQHLDWIQTRYLFVKCRDAEPVAAETRPVQVLQQDPKMMPTGITAKALAIPITAISKSRRPSVKGLDVGNNKKSKVSSDDLAKEDAYLSDDTDVEDLNVLFQDTNESLSQAPQMDGSSHPKEEIKSGDFVPGSLDHKTLPLMSAPPYATSSALKALQLQLKDSLKVQAIQPAHELGWYLNPELVDNVYQWIVELHSFDASLPIARDMKTKGVKSIVLELRFGKEYPFSPPFVRVIRPRFLPFMNGGGGHVTAGGALCMELLTNSGWNPASSIEAVLLQVRMAITSLEPMPARLDSGPLRDYDIGEAVDAYRRACLAHGWKVPADFGLFMGGSAI